MYFDTREYDSFTLPAGRYDAVRVEIGAHAGKNWFCVLFPPLCVPAAAGQDADAPAYTDAEREVLHSPYSIRFAAVELLESLPIRDLTVEDETGFYRVRDFRRMKEEHFYPWLRTLVEVCRRESGKGVSGMQLCWDLEQYAPEDIPDTVVTPMGRFRLDELADIVEAGGIQALADRFFLWDGRTQDARFFRQLLRLVQHGLGDVEVGDLTAVLRNEYGEPPAPRAATHPRRAARSRKDWKVDSDTARAPGEGGAGLEHDGERWNPAVRSRSARSRSASGAVGQA